ncbi:MAG TPA: conjugal transfer protein TrbE, partial [Dialister sp.]|nr:conjugal transfer protein TrbE [Dialister sp.]
MEYMVNYAFIDEDHENVVWCGDHGIFKVWEFRGPDMDSATPLEMMQYTALLNNALKMLGDGYIIYLDAQRHVASDYQKSKMPTPLIQQFENERAEYYESASHFETNYYIVIYKMPPIELKEKILDFFIKDSKKEQDQPKEDVYEKILEDFLKQTHTFTEILGTHCFKELKPLDATGTISYLHNIVSDHRMTVRPDPYRYINSYICDTPLITGRTPVLGKKHMRAITILSFPSASSPGMFNILNKFNFEYRWVSRWIAFSKVQADEELKNCQKLWGQQQIPLTSMIKNAITQTRSDNEIDEHAIENSDDAAAARSELNADYVSFGFYTMVMLVFDTTKKGADDKASEVVSTLNSLGFTASIETENAVEAYRGTLPSCYRCNVRRPKVSSLNFCHLAPTTATWSGDKRNDALKGPVLLYVDSSGYTPFRFSFHVGDVGHTMIVGPSGAGKSVLLNTMEAHFLKYPDSNVFIFDKGASSRCLTYGVGGNFYNLAAEGSKDLSFQPLAKIDDPDEMKWAKEWILSYLESKGVKPTPEVDNAVWNGLLSTRNSRVSLRTISQFCVLTQNMEVREALRPLTKEGSYGKLF